MEAVTKLYHTSSSAVPVHDPTATPEFVAFWTVPSVVTQLVAEVSKTEAAQLSLAGACAVEKNENDNMIPVSSIAFAVKTERSKTLFIDTDLWLSQGGYISIKVTLGLYEINRNFCLQ